MCIASALSNSGRFRFEECRADLTRGREEANVKKKLIIVFAVIAVALLLIPVRKVYEDGGTQTYTSLTYKVIVWKQIDGKSGTEFYIFPNNFHQLDYYGK